MYSSLNPFSAPGFLLGTADLLVTKTVFTLKVYSLTDKRFMLNIHKWDTAVKQVELGWNGNASPDVDSAPGKHHLGCILGVEDGWVRQSCVSGSGDRKQGLRSQALWLRIGDSQSLSIVVSSLELPALFHLSILLFFFRTVPQRMWSHFWKVSTQGLFVAMFWPLIPQFVCNCLFYWALYFNPIINIDLVVKEVRRLETQVFWVAPPTLWGTPPASLMSELWCLSEEGLGALDFLFSFPSKQGAAFSVKAYNQVLSPSAYVIVAAGTDISELGQHSSTTSHLASLLTGTWEAPSTTACKEPGSSEDVVWATSEGCHISSPNLSD